MQDKSFRQHTIQELVTRYPEVHTAQELSQLLMPLEVINPTCQAVRKRDGKPCSPKAISQQQQYCYHHLPEDAQVGRCSYKFSRSERKDQECGRVVAGGGDRCSQHSQAGRGWPRAG